MSRFQKIALIAVVSTFIMVVIGVIVRSTGSGMGCPDWPLCHGQVIPPTGDSAAWLEWIHRFWGVVIGFVMLGLVIEAFSSQRATRALTVGSIVALLLTGFQAYLGMRTVALNNSGESVTMHLATAMILLGVTVFLAVRAGYPSQLPRHGASQRLTLLLGFTAVSVFALLLFGSHVTATGSALVFPDWPLFGGQFMPSFSPDPAVASLQVAHFLHRFVTLVVGIFLAITTFVVWRAARLEQAPRPGDDGRLRVSSSVFALVGTAAVLFLVQVIVGALQIWTTLAPWVVTLHLAFGAAIWGLLIGATLVAWYDARVAARLAPDTGTGVDHQGRRPEVPPTPDVAAEGATHAAAVAGGAPTTRQKVGAYVALTKPRIIELLLVTTLPAMILAWSTVHGLDPAHFVWLAFWTLIGGTLAAGAANAINCYLDRDIDEIMVRTRRRPLPAHQVAPVDGLMFGLMLTVVSFGLLAVTTNLVAAFLTLLAVGFYVVVYTMLLKRSTPQNIVLGGAAGALPPVIGWAAVTGDITLPALLLFAIVFYWTPPHFWALSLRIRGDYAAADVPMMPVVHGVPETTRQIALYSVLMVALTLVFFAVAHMGLVFLAGVLVLGALFLFQAFAMWREGTDRRAVRLYKFSITYLTGLFLLIVLDVAIFLPLA
jgi:heme o synthase